MLKEYIQSYFNADPSEAKIISSYFHPQFLQKGDFFLRSGRPCDRMAFVASGMIRLFLNTGDKEVTQWITTKNYFTTNLSSFMFNKPARWNMQALEDSEIWVIHIFIQQPQLFNQVPLQYLASMLGMTPETLSRMRKRHLS